jgi:hypothetical protein
MNFDRLLEREKLSECWILNQVHFQLNCGSARSKVQLLLISSKQNESLLFSPEVILSVVRVS